MIPDLIFPKKGGLGEGDAVALLSSGIFAIGRLFNGGRLALLHQEPHVVFVEILKVRMIRLLRHSPVRDLTSLLTFPQYVQPNLELKHDG